MFESWIRKAEWLYASCVQDMGRDYDCYPVYSAVAIALISVLGVVIVILARRTYYAWKEEAKNRAALLALQGVASHEEMEALK